MKLAACLGRTQDDARQVVERMLAAQREEGAAAPVTYEVQGGALGWLPTSDAHAPFALAHAAHNGNVLLVSGAPVHQSAAVDRVLERAAEQGGREAATALAALDGAFAALHWDTAAASLTVVTDFLGMQPLYTADADGRLLLATDLKGIAASGLVALEPDPAGWGAFFVFGHMVGDLSFFRGVKRVPAGAVMTFTGDGPPASISYWRWPAPEPGLALSDVDVGAIGDTLARSVAAYRAYGQDGVVLMSGGFDSRLVLHLVKEAGIPARALIVRHRDEHDDADGRYAARAAQGAGVPYDVRTPPDDFYDSPLYARYLARSESANPSFGLFIAQVSAFITPEMGAVWDGLAPQAMRALPSNPTAGGFDAYLAPVRRNAEVRLRRDAAQAFARPWADAMYEAFLAALAAEVARYADDEFGVAEFSVRNRTRTRIANNPFRVYAHDVLSFTPGLTKEFYSLVGRLGERTKGAHDLTLALFRARFPEALRVPFCSGSKLVAVDEGVTPAFRLARWRAGLLKHYYIRRALERSGALGTFAFDLGPARAAMLRQIDGSDARLNPSVASALGGGRAPALADGVAQQLVYWQAVRSLAR